MIGEYQKRCGPPISRRAVFRRHQFTSRRHPDGIGKGQATIRGGDSYLTKPVAGCHTEQVVDSGHDPRKVRRTGSAKLLFGLFRDLGRQRQAGVIYRIGVLCPDGAEQFLRFRLAAAFQIV